MTIPSPRDYDGRIRVPHNLTGDGTDYAEWARELAPRTRYRLSPGKIAALFFTIAAWFAIGWAALAFFVPR